MIDSIWHYMSSIVHLEGSLKPSVEDKAVDLYVLERAFLSTHPGSESLVSLGAQIQFGRMCIHVRLGYY